MQTLEELENLLINTDKELIDLDYQLIDSLNYPEIDFLVRTFRSHIFKFSQAVAELRSQVKLKQRSKK